ncbi:GGDEF domain-containing protein [Sphingomonas sp. RS2018]
MASKVAHIAPANGGSGKLYQAIGRFLTDQRLEPDPANYAFAHAILAHPDGPLARAVSSLTDGGVRLSMRDIETLGADVTVGTASTGATERARADGLVAQTQRQVEGFEDVVTDLHAETRVFGRDLAASADAILRTGIGTSSTALDDIARLTTEMVSRVRLAEGQLEAATREAAELRSKLEEARDNARRDPLTDLPNRRALEEAFAANAAAGRTQLMAVCDVDHFKSINDRFGHAVGDRVLKAIATALAETCEGQLVARYGGEEFVALFVDTDAGTARSTLEQARAAVEAKRYKLRESDEPLGAVTFSAGLAPADDGDNARAAFQRADALLYRAKAEGRNRICVA